jgi:hypothetical protein
MTSNTISPLQRTPIAAWEPPIANCQEPTRTAKKVALMGDLSNGEWKSVGGEDFWPIPQIGQHCVPAIKAQPLPKPAMSRQQRLRGLPKFSRFLNNQQYNSGVFPFCQTLIAFFANRLRRPTYALFGQAKPLWTRQQRTYG